MISIGPRIPSFDYATSAKQDVLATKTGSDLVTEKYDSTDIVYLGNGAIDYIAYKLAGNEVARKTFSYNVAGELISTTKTP